MTDYDAQTGANIRAARTYNGIPPDAHQVPFASIGAMLESHVARTPDKECLIFYDEDNRRIAFTYAQFDARVNQTANFLMHDLGIRRGDRVATFGTNHSDLVIVYFACWKLGALVAPQNVKEDDERIHFILGNGEAVILLARAEYLDRVERIVHGADPLKNIREIVQIGGEPDDVHRHLQSECDRQPTTFTPPDPVTLDDEALLIYTSGTTGHPKGVVLVQANLLADAHGIATWNAITAEQRMMCVLPIHHANGIVMTLITPFSVGASTVLNTGYSSSHFWERLARENVQVISVVPTLLQYSLEYAQKAQAEGRSIWGEGVTRADLAGFRHFCCSAGTLAVGLATAFEDTFGFPILHGYGLSETTCITCFLPVDLNAEEHRRWLTAFGYPSIGVPIEPNEMGIFAADGSGQQLVPGERGEICVRGHNVMKHYFKRPEANAETFKFGWFRTGDEGFYQVDEGGRPFFFITGRIKELINRGGVKFSPFDIEEIMLELPEVNTALAIAFENDYYGEEVGAYVVLNDGASLAEQQVIDHCRARTTFEKSPKVVIFGTDIPVTSTGKYQRLKLRGLFADWQHEQFRA